MDEVREMLWRWDPVGIADVRRELPTEYDELASLVISMARSDVGAEKIASRLLEELRDRWGVVVPGRDLVERIRAIVDAREMP